MQRIAEIIREHVGEICHGPFPDRAKTQIARHIMHKVGDAKMHPSISMKVARALIDNRVSRSEIDELLDIVERKRETGELRKPGAYFVTSVKRIFQREEVPW